MVSIERKRATTRAWKAENSARVRATAKVWRNVHPERVRIYKKSWYAAHKEQVRAGIESWEAANPDRSRVRHVVAQRRRRARIARVLATLTPQEWEAILEAAGRACVYCGGQERLSMDHLIPISRGGPHTSENVAPACLPCNLSKGAKTVMEFLAEEEE